MSKAVFGLAKNESQAQRIVQKLQEWGFAPGEISVLYADRKDEGKAVGAVPEKGGVGHEKHTKAPEGATTGALSGGIIGGSLGMLAGAGALAIPGLGPFIAAGPIMAALAGSGLGGSLGMLIGALAGMGIPEYEAKRYEDSLRAGGILISVHTDDAQDVDRAFELLKKEGAEDLSISFEKGGDSSD
ncbi:hypothetical protein [Parachlamydia sp. AcF125]|uniref:hypothetical protein n=1 Tax=Parachlamydia sp. AcF125 TaxID=2795736 RepID=UPI001BC96E09|nr:hypothetical protein [Parachlamydia sp. AcF125]MBS4167842.1 hypothetical protein [Parachlamydia sp. AcF125]